MDSPAKASSCFSFLPKVKRRRSFRSRRKSTSAARVSWPTVPREIKDVHETPPCKIQVEELVSFLTEGNVKTFAICCVQCKGHTRSGSGGGKLSERMTVYPFFGRFAGREIVFDLRTLSEPLTTVKVKMVDEDAHNAVHFTTLYHRPTGHSGENVKDRCIRFLHDVDRMNFQSECTRNQQPKSLQFLCKQAIILHNRDLDVSRLPKKFSYIQPNPSEMQKVSINVWWPCPHKPVASLQMNLLKGLSVAELKWMLCNSLSMPMNPTCLELYQNDHIETMPPDSTLNTTSFLNCIVQLPIHFDRTVATVTVSIIGQGMTQIVVNKSMTLFQFQQAVRAAFSLKPSSFIYFPSICHNVKNKVVAETGLKMTATVDNSTISLINSMRRNFPIVDGVPSLLMDYSRIPLYQLNVDELSISSPLVGFEVTGPTIPLQITTAQGHELSKDFVVVSQRVHAVSVNPKWTIANLLKYIECVSRFPCYGLRVGKTILQGSALVGQHLTNRCWLIQSQRGLDLTKDIPVVQH